MSSCLSGGGRAYGFEPHLVKSPSTSSRTTSHSSSPSSTISESSNSPIAISNRKPRTPRKRPNQTYNEAAALLSTAYPKIFSAKHLTKPCKSSKLCNNYFNEPPELLHLFRSIDNSGFLLQQPILDKPNFLNNVATPKVVKSCERPCQSPWESELYNSSLIDEDFDAESILDEEMEEGIDSIMGNLSVNNDIIDESNTCIVGQVDTCYGYPMGLGFVENFDFGFGMRGVRALRNVNDSNWWSFHTVEVVNISSSKFNKVNATQKKKKRIDKSVEKLKQQCQTPKQDNSAATEVSVPPDASTRPRLKLNYDKVLEAWSDRSSPLPDDISGSESSGNDVHARLAQIDLFSDVGGVREASVQRYKEKRRNRLFSKKIRYQVRKVNADRRPRMKGRFVRRQNSSMSGEEDDEK